MADTAQELGGIAAPWNALRNVGPQGEKKASISGVAFRLYLQSLVRDLLPKERAGGCLRKIAPSKFVGDGDVKVCYSPTPDGAGRAFFKNLLVCKMIWICPPCSSKITEGRRAELAQAVQVAAEQGLYAVMLTFTLRHKRSDKLADVLLVLRSSFQRFHAGRWANEWRKAYGVVGHTRGLEATFGDNGWHPHYHEIVFMTSKLESKESVEAFEKEVKARWLAIASGQGFDPSWEHGLNVRSDALEIAEYVAKYGHQPVRSKRWGIEHELAKGAAKIGKKEGRSPFQLLADFGDGDKLAGLLFQEYWKVFKGQRQLYWSRGLKKRFGIDEVLDAELAEEQVTLETRILASLSAAQWRVVLAHDARGQLLDLARSGSGLAVREFLESLSGMPDLGYSKQNRDREFAARFTFRLGMKVSWLDDRGKHYGKVVDIHAAGGLLTVSTFVPGSAQGWFEVKVRADQLREDDF